MAKPPSFTPNPFSKQSTLILGLFTVFVFVILYWIFMVQMPMGSDGLNWIERTHFSYRQLMVHRDRTQEDIAIIEIDDATLGDPTIQAKYGRYPFHRNLFATLIQYLNRGQPKGLLLDFSFDGGPDDCYPQGDALFVDAIKDAHFPIVSGYATHSLIAPNPAGQAFIDQHKVPIQGSSDTLSHFPTQQGSNLPLASLTNTPMIFATPQGILSDPYTMEMRRFIPFYCVARPGTTGCTHAIPHFALQMAAIDAQDKPIIVHPDHRIEWGNHIFHLQNQWSPLIFWNGEINHPYIEAPNNAKLETSQQSIDVSSVYKRYSLKDLLESERYLWCQDHTTDPTCHPLPQKPARFIAPSTFNHQTVLIGITIENIAGNSDTHQTIYSRHKNYPGIYIVANIIDNLQNGDFVKPLGVEYTILGCLIALGFVFYCVYRIQFLPLELVCILILIFGHFTLVNYLYVEHHLWLNWTLPTLVGILSYVLFALSRFYHSEKRKQQLRLAFGKYLAPSEMAYIESRLDTLELGGQRSEVSIMFCDIRGFTTFAEKNNPEYVQKVLSKYFTSMHQIIQHNHHGTLNKIIGDAIMAYWGFPVSQNNHALAAVRAALAMQEELIRWRADKNNPPLSIGVGIHTGDVMIGNIGSKEYMDFTLIGDAVNLAARLESKNKDLDTTIIISEATYLRIKGSVQCRPLGEVSIRGRQDLIKVYEPLTYID